MDRIHLAQNTDQWRLLVYIEIHFWVPLNVEKFLSSLTTAGFSKVLISMQQTNSVALVRERTTTTKRPPLVGEVSATVCG
jgi:hypothetical protein